MLQPILKDDFFFNFLNKGLMMTKISKQLETQLEEFKKSWAQAITTRDLKLIQTLYSESAVLKPTLSPYIRQGHTEIFPYFEGGGPHHDVGFFNQKIEEVQFLDSFPVSLGDALIDTGHYAFIIPGKEDLKVDYTFALRPSDSGKELMIVGHHSSLTYLA